MRLSVAAESEIRRAWRLLDVANIDGTRASWERAMTSIIVRYQGLSTQAAEDYLARYELAELVSRVGPIARVQLDLSASLGVLDAAGPQALKRSIGRGVNPIVAYENLARSVRQETQKLILSGGRGTIVGAAQRDSRAIGWRRVSDGDPCAFCAMLVSRGPSYTSEAAALAKGNADPYHKGCGCTVEVLYGPWTPNEAEQVYVDQYYTAAEAADAAGEPRTADTVLYRMRADGGFRDSPARRSALAP